MSCNSNPFCEGFVEAVRDVLKTGPNSPVAGAILYKYSFNADPAEQWLAGYRRGLDVGIEEVLGDIKAKVDDAFEAGYDGGYSNQPQTMEQAFNEGHTAGREIGYTQGLRIGRKQAEEERVQPLPATSAELAAVRDEGYQEGFTQGHASGYTYGRMDARDSEKTTNVIHWNFNTDVMHHARLVLSIAETIKELRSCTVSLMALKNNANYVLTNEASFLSGAEIEKLASFLAFGIELGKHLATDGAVFDIADAISMVIIKGLERSSLGGLPEGVSIPKILLRLQDVVIAARK